VISDGLVFAYSAADAIWAMGLFAVTLLLIAAGVFVVRRFRGGADQDRPVDTQWLENLEEARARGELSDAEFRTIKTRIRNRISDELKDNAEKG
jgi:uncharacterized membrane protein